MTLQRYRRFFIVAMCVALASVATAASADHIKSGTATRVGEPQTDSEAGRSQIRICGTVWAEVDDLRRCTFQLSDLGFSVDAPPIYKELDPKRGGKATEVTFESNQRARPTLKARFQNGGNDKIEFCINVDRAIIDPAPAGISTEPCVDEETADLTLSFDLNCDDGLIAFSETATWRVPLTTCPTDFPNMRTP
jgi:hypothetical protein